MGLIVGLGLTGMKEIGSVIRLPVTRAGVYGIHRYVYGRSDIDDYNPYSPLRDRANMD